MIRALITIALVVMITACSPIKLTTVLPDETPAAPAAPVEREHGMAQ